MLTRMTCISLHIQRPLTSQSRGSVIMAISKRCFARDFRNRRQIRKYFGHFRAKIFLKSSHWSPVKTGQKALPCSQLDFLIMASEP
jgi:hypothetical protein